MSNYERYNEIKFSADRLLFQFESSGPRGKIIKLVEFALIAPGVYNLAFGNRLDGDSIDDAAVSDNEDRDKILATIAAIVDEFTNYYPAARLYFTGSTNSRTRLYRMALTKAKTELLQRYIIMGLTDGKLEPFGSIKDYDGFVILRKENT